MKNKSKTNQLKMSQSKNKFIETYSMSCTMENIKFLFPQGTGATLFLEWKMGKKGNKLQRTVCKEGVTELGSISFNGTIQRDNRSFHYLKKNVKLSLFNVVKTKSKLVGELKLNLTQYIQQEVNEIELPLANGTLTFILTIQTDIQQITLEDGIIDPVEIENEIDEMVDMYEELEEEKFQLIERKEFREKTLDLMKRNQVLKGDITREENHFLINEIFLSKMTFSNRKQPLTADVIFSKLNENRLLKSDKQQFLDKIISILKQIMDISIDNPKKFIYWLGVCACLSKRVHSEIITKNLSDKNVKNKFVQNLFQLLVDQMNTLHDHIEQKIKRNYEKFFTDFNNQISLKNAFEPLILYLDSMKRDNISKTIISIFCKRFIIYFDRYIFNLLMKNEVIQLEVSFYIPCQIAAFCEMLRNYSSERFENDFILLNSITNLSMVSIEVINANELITQIAPNISFKQIFDILNKFIPFLNMEALSRLKNNMTNLKDKKPACMDEKALPVLEFEEITNL